MSKTKLSTNVWKKRFLDVVKKMNNGSTYTQATRTSFKTADNFWFKKFIRKNNGKFELKKCDIEKILDFKRNVITKKSKIRRKKINNKMVKSRQFIELNHGDEIPDMIESKIELKNKPATLDDMFNILISINERLAKRGI